MQRALYSGDLKFAGTAFVLVFVCMLGYTRSLWTTVNGLLGIVLSCPTAFLFFRLVSAGAYTGPLISST